MTDEDRKIVDILSAVAAIDLKTHPIHEAIKARHGANGSAWTITPSTRMPNP